MLTKLLHQTAGEQPREGELYKHLHIAGQTFLIYYGYYEESDRTGKYSDPIPIYPDFNKHPVYTSDGAPFVTLMQDTCSHYKPRRYSAEPDCSICQHLERGEELIGVCRCPQRKCLTKVGSAYE